ncbi:MAG TPA: hypothetical protein PLL09_03905 [Flavobacterium sp.]|nr:MULTISPECIES: hypothetical protein [unclassified Flavobacterium]HBI02098.1 hypothetical protein [Flavobacterium sp.]HRE76950.1 hypothetical protein [Flavobacterium sp.]
MKKVGGYLMFFGVFALVLSFLDRVPSLLIWIYNWGDVVAYAIMGGMTAVGALLYFLSPKEVEEVQEVAPQEATAEVNTEVNQEVK